MSNSTRISLAFGTLAAAALLSVAAFAKAYTLPPVASKKDVKAAELAAAQAQGDQNIGTLCKASVIQTIQNNGGTGNVTVKSVKHPTANTAVVKLDVVSDLFSGGLTCKLTKSNWSISGIQ